FHLLFLFGTYYLCPPLLLLFFIHVPSTTAISTLSLHDALPISIRPRSPHCVVESSRNTGSPLTASSHILTFEHSSKTSTPPSRSDRKSTRLNSSHVSISYAVFCLKKKRGTNNTNTVVRSKSIST